VQKQPTLYEQTEANVQFYGRVLFTTGGRLALHKCAIHLLRTIWRHGQRHYAQTHTTTRPMRVQQDVNQGHQEVQIVSPSEARRMLGVYVAPDGNCNLQESLLRSKSEVWSTRIKNNRMATYEVFMSYDQGIMKSLEFPLGASLLNEKQCKHIQSPALSSCLQKTGVASTMSRSLVFGPKRFCGLGFRNLYTEAGIQKLELFMGHIRKLDVTGTIILIALACLQQEIGISVPVLSSSYTLYSCIVTPSWNQNLWCFLNDISGTMVFPQTWTPRSCFQYDTNIMEQVIHMNFSAKQKYQINMCRLYKKVYYLGELLNVTGTKFRPHIFDLSKPGFHNDKFPQISLPSSFAELWKSAILAISKNRDLGTSFGLLRDISSYEYCLDSSMQILLKYRKHKIISCHLRNPTGDGYNDLPSTLHFNFDPEFVAEVKKAGNMLVVLRYRKVENENNGPAVPPVDGTQDFYHFKQFLYRMPLVHVRNLGELTTTNWDGFFASFVEGNIIGVADASVNLKSGCHSYILESRDETSHIQGQAPVDADPDDMTSNRAEMCGVLAILKLTTALTRFTKGEGVEIPVYCDNLEALRRPTMHNKTYTKLTTADMDLKIEILKILDTSPNSYKFLHVKGHADEEEGFEYEEADQQTKRNIDMDIAAKRFLSKPPSHLAPSLTPLFFPAQKLCLQILGVNIVGDMRKQIYLYRHGSVIEDDIRLSLKISSKEMEKLEWEGLERAFAKMSPQDRVSRMKIVHMQLPTRSLLKRRGEVDNSQCLRCCRQPETFQHLFTCTNRLAQVAHRTALAHFRQKLRKNHTHILLIDAFSTFLDQVHKRKNVKYVTPMLGDAGKILMTEQVVTQQIHLGKYSLHRGIISRNWMVLQNEFQSKSDSRQKNLVWLRNLIRALWTYSYDIWVSRCKQVHTKNPEDLVSMNHEELKKVVRGYLNIDRTKLSVLERKLHLNVTKKLPYAHPRTLVRWILLLKDERTRTEHDRRTVRKIQRNQQITRFFPMRNQNR